MKAGSIPPFDFSEGFAVFAHKLSLEHFSFLFDFAIASQNKEAFLALAA